jgi:hypothetical protein
MLALGLEHFGGGLGDVPVFRGIAAGEAGEAWVGYTLAREHCSPGRVYPPRGARLLEEGQ